MSENYYTLTNFRNTIYALNLSIETFYANLLFKGDASKIIYSNNGNAFRERSSTQSWSNLDLPFMNYYLKSVTQQTDRPWWNHPLNIGGVYVEELERKFRMTPIKVEYESTVFFHRDDDLHYALMELTFDDSNETLFTPTIEIDGEEISLLAVLGYDIDFEPEFSPTDFFEKNRIHSIALNFSFDYIYIKDNTSNFAIPLQFVLEWGRMHDDGLLEDEAYTFMIDHFNETVTEET